MSAGPAPHIDAKKSAAQHLEISMAAADLRVVEDDVGARITTNDYKGLVQNTRLGIFSALGLDAELQRSAAAARFQKPLPGLICYCVASRHVPCPWSCVTHICVSVELCLSQPARIFDSQRSKAIANRLRQSIACGYFSF
jgi:hypothetical protein